MAYQVTHNGNQSAQQQTALAVSSEKKVAVLAKETANWINGEIQKNFTSVPSGYPVGSEASLFMMKVLETKDKNGRSAIDVCKKESIMTQAKMMMTNGLYISKNQCYLIVYGEQLQLMRSYFGMIAQLKRIFPAYDIKANVVYEGDKYDYVYDEDIDCYMVKNIEPKVENRRNKIKLAFAKIKEIKTGRIIHSEVMDWEDIQVSWSHAKTDKVQKEFPSEMAKRTVLNRCCKTFVNTATEGVDSEAIDAYNRQLASEYVSDSEEVSTRDVEVEKAIRSKSRGNDGLSELLSKVAEDASEAVAEDVKEVKEDAKEVDEDKAPQTEADTETEDDFDPMNVPF